MRLVLLYEESSESCWYVMGVYSTVTITREEAIRRITDALETATNEELSRALFALTEDHVLDNYTVILDEAGLPALKHEGE